MLSRIDGAASVQVLADLTNLEEDHVYRMAERLIELGAAEWSRESVSLPLPTGRPSTRTPSREVEVPPFLRGPPQRPVQGPARVRMRSEERPSVRPPVRLEGVYSSKPPTNDEVDMERSSVFPSSPRTRRSSAPTDASAGPPVDMPPPPPVPTVDVPLPPPPSAERLAKLAEAHAATFEDLPLPPSEPPAPTTPDPDPAPEVASLVEPAPEPVKPTPTSDLEALEALVAEVVAEPLAASEPAPAASAVEPELEPEPEPASASEPEPASEPAPEAKGEELDLDEERQHRIDNLYFALELLDHYQVLGVGRGAARAEIRDAYFQLSKVFHPDTMFRKRLGAYKARMEAIFQRLTEAYETLGKKKHREEYDHYLSLQDRTREVERSLDEPNEDEERERLGRAAAQYEADVAAGRPPSVETEIPEELRGPPPKSAAPPPPSAPAPTSSTPPEARRAMSEEGKRAQRELMAKKLRNATRASGSSRRGASPPPPPTSTAPKADRKEVLRGLASTLRQTSAQTGGLDPVQRSLGQAKRAEAEGDLAEAANHLRAAMLRAPDRADIAHEHARISVQLSKAMATTYEERAIYEERHGKWAAAAISWGKVVEGRPDDAHAAQRAAVALVEAGGDMHKAKQLAQKAADLDPDNVANLRGLARVYIAAGLELNARRVLQHAAKLDPDDEMVENLLRDLGR
ncbi:MAG: DnaJ domain-containing protein [Sandaracinaceae bacterium]|nr:DnaJ domain-containing protein [Sandaracinaceae bacterium]